MKADRTQGSIERYLTKYRAWCRFFPTEFKKRFGGELEQVFQTSLEEAEEKYGERGMEAEYRAAIADIVPAILHEQLTSLPTVQRMFSGGNLLWRLYVLLYWPLVGLGALGLTSVNLTPVAATFLVALYLLAHLAIWFATASVRLSVVVVVSSIVLFYVQQFSGFVFSTHSQVYRTVVDTFNVIAVIAVAVAPYVVSLIVHARKEKTAHQKVRLMSAEELFHDDERRCQKRHRRNTIALITLFLMLMVNVAFLVVDAGKAERVWGSALLYPPYPGDLQSLKRSDNLYYSLIMIDGPAATGDNQHPVYKLFRDVTEKQHVSDVDRVNITALAEPLGADFARFAEAAAKPYFLHPILSGANGWPIQGVEHIDYPSAELVNFRQLAILSAVAADKEGDIARAQSILRNSVSIGKRMAAASPNEVWYWAAQSFIGDVRAVMPMLSQETREVVMMAMPSESEIMTMRKSYLENYAMVAMSKVNQFEREHGLAGLTFLYLSNQTKLELESTVRRLQERKLACEDTVALQASLEQRYENYSEWNGFRDYVVPQVLTRVAVNGQGKGLLQSLFQFSGEDMYFHYSMAAPECVSLGFQARKE